MSKSKATIEEGLLRIGLKDVAKVFSENAEISKLLTASVMFVFKKFYSFTYFLFIKAPIIPIENIKITLIININKYSP